MADTRPLSNTALALQRNMDRCRAASITACSCHLSPPFHAPKHSNFLHSANESQACFLPIALDLPAGRALRLFPLLFPQILCLRRFWAVFPKMLVAVGFFAFLLRETVM